MSDIQKINTDKSIDNGGITVRYPFGEGEGRDAKISSQNIKTQASNLLNKFKPLRSFEAKTFSSLYSMLTDKTLGIYQSDLPYPSTSNFTLKSQLDLGIGVFSVFNEHYIFNYNNYIYVCCNNNNIKYIDADFNISEIDIGYRWDQIFFKDNDTIFTLLDNKIYQIDLTNNTSSVYGTLDSAIPYPVDDIKYDNINNKFICGSSEKIFISNNSLTLLATLNNTVQTLFNNKNGTFIASRPLDGNHDAQDNFQIDLSDNSITTLTDNKNYHEYIDLFCNNYIKSTDITDELYSGSTLLGSLTLFGDASNDVLSINQATDTIVVREADKRNVYSLTNALNGKLSKLVELD
tara:strand:- start:63316 stop:64359 length:1044 start_codon:yes stop_codon:yes gene_type:complete